MNDSRLTGRQRILLVDDSETSRAHARLILRQAGYEVFCAEDGIEALVMLAECRAALVFMDNYMPRMNGYDACRHIRASLLKGVAVVMLTACDTDADRELAREAGANAFLAKPVSPACLLEMAGRFCPSARASAMAREPAGRSAMPFAAPVFAA